MMSKIKIVFYGYDRCGTCVKAQKYLEERQIEFTKIPIREKPPTKKSLKMVLEKVLGGEIKKLFNTSGKDYREGGWKDKIDPLSTDELLSELSQNGNLIKRPFVVIEGGECAGLVGFNEKVWDEKLK